VSAINQHKHLAMSGKTGQEVSESTAGAVGKPTDRQSKSPLIGAAGGGDKNTSGNARVGPDTPMKTRW
jgi:hypothetical protein